MIGSGAELSPAKADIEHLKSHQPGRSSAVELIATVQQDAGGTGIQNPVWQDKRQRRRKNLSFKYESNKPERSVPVV